MTIFLSPTLPQNPAFLYATYGSTVTAAASSTATGYAAANVFLADESSGWKPVNLEQASLTIDFGVPVTTDFFAVAGSALAGAKADIFGSANGTDFTQISPFGLIATDGSNKEAWRRYDAAQYRYFRLLMSFHTSNTVIKHLIFGLVNPLPFLEDGACVSPLQSEGEHLISHAGLYLGSVTHRVMRPFSINFGKIITAKKPAFDTWAANCITIPRAFFFVPNLAQPTCHFGWVDKKYKYEPTQKAGAWSIPKIPFTARAI